MYYAGNSFIVNFMMRWPVLIPAAAAIGVVAAMPEPTPQSPAKVVQEAPPSPPPPPPLVIEAPKAVVPPAPVKKVEPPPAPKKPKNG